MVSLGSYLLSAALLAALLLALGFSAYRLRARLIPDWTGTPARLAESITAIALLIWLSESLGIFGLLYAWTLVVLAVLLALAIALWTRPAPAGGGGDGGGSRTDRGSTAVPPAIPDRTRGPGVLSLIVMFGAIGLVVAHWGLTTDSALDRGIFNFDSLWYHMPFSAEIAQSHSVTGFDRTETVFTNWFYPQNSELLHAVGILVTERDTLSLFINFGWLALAFLAAWTIGRPWERGHLSVVAVAILLTCHTLVVREPGAAKNDLAAAALVLAAIAILITAWETSRADERTSLPVGWPLAVAGLAIGLAAGTKFTVLAMAAALSLAVVVLAPAGRRLAAAAWWFVPALLGGGYWYLRNLVAVGNPLPEVGSLGPIDLPNPEHLQSGRPDFNIAHYATDTGVWGDYFAPGLHDAFGGLWPLVLLAALAAALVAIGWGRSPAVRWSGAAALFGMVAYLFTPLSAAGAEGAPTAFEINIRFVVPALLAALALLPLSRAFDDRRRQAALLAVLVVVLVLTDRSDAVLRDPSRLFGIGLALLFVAIPAGLLLLRRRGTPTAAVGAGFAALAIVLVAIGYPLQRNYLEARFAADVPADERIPGNDLDDAYIWARDVEDARIGLVGTTAGFLGYGFYGADLSNRVLYLGERGPQGTFDAIPTCGRFRAAVNDAGLDYLVTAPFLNFIDTGSPVPSPEARWLRGATGARPIDRSGTVTIWKIEGQLDTSCGPAQAPLRQVPDSPVGQ
ncbi:MAG TPA: hypothetical protein VIT85_03380 [Solirubrobacterales bacterium]